MRLTQITLTFVCALALSAPAFADAVSPEAASAAEMDAIMNAAKAKQAAALTTTAKTFAEELEAKAAQRRMDAADAAFYTPALDESAKHFALGLGYPDLRLRGGFGHGIFADAKLAFDSGISVYTARLGWNFWDLAPMKVFVAAEGGLASISDVDTVNASGAVAGMSLGVEYPFAKKFRLSLDAGPMWVSGSNSQASYSTTDVVFNTALYYYLF